MGFRVIADSEVSKARRAFSKRAGVTAVEAAKLLGVTRRRAAKILLRAGFKTRAWSGPSKVYHMPRKKA